MSASQNGHLNSVKCLINAKAQLDLQTNASIDHITLTGNIQILININIKVSSY